jgi:hypothetical protein
VPAPAAAQPTALDRVEQSLAVAAAEGRQVAVDAKVLREA